MEEGVISNMNQHTEIRVSTARAITICLILGCTAVVTAHAVIAQTPQKSATHSSSRFQVGVHFSRGQSETGKADSQAIAREMANSLAGNLEQPVMTPTRSTFLAKWQAVSSATGYRLDVSTSPLFDSYVTRYRDLDLGKVTSHVVSGLNRGTKYYYRVRTYSSAGTASSSDV